MTIKYLFDVWTPTEIWSDGLNKKSGYINSLSDLVHCATRVDYSFNCFEMCDLMGNTTKISRLDLRYCDD